MKKTIEVELTVMCAIINDGKVLMINRKNDWGGWAFPGGHLEANESLVECTIREIKEETGLVIKDLKFKGNAHFYNPITNERHIISNYVCLSYDGVTKTKCKEGILSWVKIKDIKIMDLAEGMEYRLPLFFTNGQQELYVEWTKDKGYIKVKYNKV